jgi:hypothetical protein
MSADSNPAVGFQVDFYWEEKMQKIGKFLVRQQLVFDRDAGKSLQVAVTPVGHAV